MNHRVFLFLLLLLVPISGNALTKEEEKAKHEVLKEYASEEERQKIIDARDKRDFFEKTKDTLSDGLRDLKEQLPDNVKSLLPETDMEKVKSGKALPATQAGDHERAINDSEVNSKEVSEIKKSLDDNIFLKILSPEQREAAAKMMKKNPFAKMKKAAIKEMILVKMDPGKPAGKYLIENPKIVDTAAEWFVDDKAIPAFISIIDKPDKAKMITLIVFSVFVTIFVINLKNSKRGLLKRILFKIGLMMTSALINLGAFYFVYREELEPTIDVIKRSM